MIAQHKRWLQAALLLLVSICVGGCASESLVSSSIDVSGPPMLYKEGQANVLSLRLKMAKKCLVNKYDN